MSGRGVVRLPRGYLFPAHFRTAVRSWGYWSPPRPRGLRLAILIGRRRLGRVEVGSLLPGMISPGSRKGGPVGPSFSFHLTGRKPALPSRCSSLMEAGHRSLGRSSARRWPGKKGDARSARPPACPDPGIQIAPVIHHFLPTDPARPVFLRVSAWADWPPRDQMCQTGSQQTRAREGVDSPDH